MLMIEELETQQGTIKQTGDDNPSINNGRKMLPFLESKVGGGVTRARESGHAEGMEITAEAAP